MPENKNDFDNLDKSLKEIALPPSGELISANDSMIYKLNGRTIIFEKNITEIDSLKFNFSAKENGTVIFYKNKSKEKYPLVLSTNTYAISTDPTLQLPVALQATCENENEFVLHYNQLCRINNFYFHFIIGEESISTTLEETSNFIKANVISSLR